MAAPVHTVAMEAAAGDDVLVVAVLVVAVLVVAVLVVAVLVVVVAVAVAVVAVGGGCEFQAADQQGHEHPLST